MVSSNPGTSHLIVTDTESQIKAIDTFITEIDQITSQIMVEVRIYDITENELLDLGVEWRAGRDTTWTPPIGPGGFRPFVSTPSGTTDPHIDGTFQSSSRETSDVLGAFRLGWLNDSLNVDAILHAQLENTKAKLLANPRILVVDNEVATFNIVREIPYKESTVSAGGSTETIKFKNVGVNLEVMPHVTRDGLLRLSIAPDFGVVVGQDDATGVVVVDTRKLSTTTLVNDGDTVVLAGLHKKDVAERVNKIPLLGDLPIIGVLFKFEGEDTANNELVVFITPQIIEQPAPLTEFEQKAWQHTEWPAPEPANTYKEDPDKKWFDWGNEDEE
jgi:type IV pilus assembly protein PilQ